jgi:hypothetical protein
VNCAGTKKFALNKIGLALILTGRSISLIGSAGNESGKRLPTTFFEELHEIKKSEAVNMKNKNGFIDFMVYRI